MAPIATSEASTSTDTGVNASTDTSISASTASSSSSSSTGGPFLQLVYTSHTPESFPSAESVASILGVSRRNNEKNGITGLLIYSNASFLQFLEGPASAVEHVFSKIQRDPRHRGLITVLRLTVEQRSFPDWSMAYRDLDIAEAAVNEEREHAVKRGDDPETINVDRAARHGLNRVLLDEMHHDQMSPPVKTLLRTFSRLLAV